MNIVRKFGWIAWLTIGLSIAARDVNAQKIDPTAPVAPAKSPATATVKIDLNTATATELEDTARHRRRDGKEDHRRPTL